MVITGSVLLIDPVNGDHVRESLKAFTEVTYHVASPEGSELVVNLEAEDQRELEALCGKLKAVIPEITEISHVYVNFEEEVEKAQRGAVAGEDMFKPDFDDEIKSNQRSESGA